MHAAGRFLFSSESVTEGHPVSLRAALAAGPCSLLHWQAPASSRCCTTTTTTTTPHTAAHAQDKLADGISDAILDACLAQDPGAKVACETAVKGNYLLVFGEVGPQGGRLWGGAAGRMRPGARPGTPPGGRPVPRQLVRVPRLHAAARLPAPARPARAPPQGHDARAGRL